MNKELQAILNLIQQSSELSDEEKKSIAQSLKAANKELEITAFKLDRTEKVKRTTAILLEETIEELEQKRRAVEAQNKELEIEAALEKVRSASLSMHKSDELQKVVNAVFERLQALYLSMNVASIFIFEEGSKDWQQWVASSDTSYSTHFHIPYTDNIIFSDLEDAKQTGKDFYAARYPKEEKDRWFSYAFAHTEYNRIPEARKKFLLESDFYQVSFAVAKNTGIQLAKYSGNDFSEKENEILKRFSRVFEQAYTRFLDLQKAEAQSRESQIQLALERVRARTMAMQKSEELGEISSELFKQVQSLGITSWHCAFNIYDEDQNSSTEWGTNAGGTYPIYKTPRERIFLKYYETAQTGVPLHIEVIGEDRCADHYEWLCTLPGIGDQLVKLREAGIAFPVSQVDHVAYFKYGYLIFISYQQESWAHEIFIRFAKVFEQTYTRFLDLQKSEAQAKEAKIEAALERTRTQSMIMQHSNELDNTLRVFHEQVLLLGIRSAFSFLWLPDEEKDRHIFWAAWAENNSTVFKSKAINYPLDRNEAATAQCLLDWKGNEPIVSYHVQPASVNDYFAAWSELIAGVDELRPANFSEGLYYVEAFMKYGCFGIMTWVDLTADEKKILGRFAIEFERTYTRFLDLKKAEAQTREAQIEAALEKVRSRSLAMHQSDELEQVIMVVSEQLLQLQFRFHNVSFSSTNEQQETTFWLATPGRPHPFLIQLPYIETTMLTRVFEARINGVDFFSDTLTAGENQEWLQHLVYKSRHSFTEEDKKYLLTLKGLARSTVLTKHIILAIINYAIVPYSDEQNFILRRFGNVFEQAYTRFLDLQKAEAQARQAKIEGAMEKVRSRAMAMQKPHELIDVAQLLRTEMGLLGVEELETSSIYIHHEATGNTECWYAIQQEKHLVSDHMNIHLPDTWVGREMLAFYRSGKTKTSIVMQGENRTEWINYCASHSTALVGYYGDHIPDRTYHLYKFSNGYMGAASPGEISNESWELLQRATAVFSLAYTRFNDLQLAEAQARESQIEVALERVRGRTLAMQKSDELAETAAVLFKQLIGLGIAPNRLYIGIVNNDDGEIEFWITDEDGSKVSTMFTGNAYKNGSMKKMHDGWKEQRKSILIDMQGMELADYFHYLGDELHVPFKGGLEQKRRLQYIAYFSKGFIGMASPDEQPEETMLLLERFAAVFNLTFTRFSDLKIAEAHALQAELDLIEIKAARKKAEETLTELQSTQKQLIQSEKMASLGELTAGIAHEIQNPLNFVNNFSEVNKELAEELNSELAVGNQQSAVQIANDIKENSEKINHHGKRADAIVKGMLQHSRSTSTTKEPTDINSLADEYLRLAYHGLRAKDKSFNATMKTDYDETIGRVSIIPQDIGRVILNVITNAFYTVNEKKKVQGDSYDPIVSLSTKKLDDAVEISVKDNGNGIPQGIVDKIFQPFFTTKPTGQGTGLGLSLAYDIVKAHGGALKVETKENEGSKFLIQFAVTKNDLL